MIAERLLQLAATVEQWGTRAGASPEDQFTMLGLSAELDHLARRAAVLEGPGACRMQDLPEGVIDLAARRPRTPTISNGDAA